MGLFSKKNKEPYTVNVNELENEAQKEWIEGVFKIFADCGATEYACIVDPMENNFIYFGFRVNVINNMYFEESFWGSQMNEPELLNQEFGNIANREVWVDGTVKKLLEKKQAGDKSLPDVTKLAQSAEAGAVIFEKVFNNLLAYAKEKPYMATFPKGLDKPKKKGKSR